MNVKLLFSSKYTSMFLDAVGVFSLASFLFATLFLNFLVEMLPQCYFTDALIPFVECGNSFSGEILKTYFMFFTPLIIGFGMLVFYGLFVSLFHLAILQFLWSLLIASIMILTVVTSIRIVYKTVKRLTWKRKSYSSKERRIASLLLLLIFIPTIAASSFKYYLVPPQSSEKIINIDLWHSTLSVQRNYLSKWSLSKIERPDKEPSPFANIMRRNKRTHPFATFDLPAQTIDESAQINSNIFITVSPHYMVMSDEEMYENRAELLEQRISKTHYKDKLPIYEKAQPLNDWEIYKGRTDINAISPDLYVLRNNTGQITHLLQCTADTDCVTFHNGASRLTRKCKSETECESCFRVCSTLGSGTHENNISYTFPKENIDTYFEFYPKVIDFVDSKITKK